VSSSENHDRGSRMTDQTATLKIHPEGVFIPWKLLTARGLRRSAIERGFDSHRSLFFFSPHGDTAFRPSCSSWFNLPPRGQGFSSRFASSPCSCILPFRPPLSATALFAGRKRPSGGLGYGVLSGSVAECCGSQGREPAYR
jgi:hypothetical protein